MKRKSKRDGERKYRVVMRADGVDREIPVGIYWAVSESEAKDMARKEYRAYFNSLELRSYALHAYLSDPISEFSQG